MFQKRSTPLAAFDFTAGEYIRYIGLWRWVFGLCTLETRDGRHYSGSQHHAHPLTSPPPRLPSRHEAAVGKANDVLKRNWPGLAKRRLGKKPGRPKVVLGKETGAVAENALSTGSLEKKLGDAHGALRKETGSRAGREARLASFFSRLLRARELD